jgi:hypothetical protein
MEETLRAWSEPSAGRAGFTETADFFPSCHGGLGEASLPSSFETSTEFRPTRFRHGDFFLLVIGRIFFHVLSKS